MRSRGLRRSDERRPESVPTLGGTAPGDPGWHGRCARGRSGTDRRGRRSHGAAWADEHETPVFEPWRGEPSGGRYGYRDRYGYGARDRYDEGWDPRDDDLGDGDPEGYRDPTVVPFPFPARPPAPARSGLPWETEEETTIRSAWLAADPEADRDALLREIAATVERGIGGVTVRLRQVGCEPARPGCALDRPWVAG